MKNESFDDLVTTLLIIFLTIFCMTAGGALGYNMALTKFRTEAVKGGYASWTVSDDGTTTFQWKK